MKKIEKIKIIFMTITLLIIVCTTNFILCRQLNSKSDAIRVKNFYRLEKNSLDMLFIGASTAFTDYSAPLAWKEFGYTSYSFATNMAPMGIAKSMLIEARKSQNPKVFVIDINGILYDDTLEDREGAKRLWIDNMPLSKNKIDTIKELVSKDERLAYYIPLLKYHSNWTDFFECLDVSIEECTNTDYVNLSSLGIQGSTKVEPQRNYVNIKEYTQTLPMHHLSGQHLKELLEYCKSENLQNVIFTNMPRYYSTEMLPERGRNNAAKELIKEYGYECLDMDDYVDEIGLDPEIDFYNQNHLNVYGQKKLTIFLGNLLNERFQLSNNRHDKNICERFNQEYDSYTKIYNWVDTQIKNGKQLSYNFDVIKDVLENGR